MKMLLALMCITVPLSAMYYKPSKEEQRKAVVKSMMRSHESEYKEDLRRVEALEVWSLDGDDITVLKKMATKDSHSRLLSHALENKIIESQEEIAAQMLQYAVSQGAEYPTRTLLDWDVDPNRPVYPLGEDQNVFSILELPLPIAVRKSNTALVWELLRAKADPNNKKAGVLPLLWAMYRYHKSRIKQGNNYFAPDIAKTSGIIDQLLEYDADPYLLSPVILGIRSKRTKEIRYFKTAIEMAQVYGYKQWEKIFMNSALKKCKQILKKVSAQEADDAEIE